MAKFKYISLGFPVLTRIIEVKMYLFVLTCIFFVLTRR